MLHGETKVNQVCNYNEGWGREKAEVNKHQHVDLLISNVTRILFTAAWCCF